MRAGKLAECSALASRAAHYGKALRSQTDRHPVARCGGGRTGGMRLTALEDGVEADLGLGDGPRRIGDLTKMVAQHPFGSGCRRP